MDATRGLTDPSTLHKTLGRMSAPEVNNEQVAPTCDIGKVDEEVTSRQRRRPMDMHEPPHGVEHTKVESTRQIRPDA